MNNEITIHFDGGCKPNPGNKYGSFEIQRWGRTIERQSRFPLGHGTNNEAEFQALEAALIWCLNNSNLPGTLTIKIVTDSTVVRNRIQGRNKTNKSEPQKRMYELCATCLELLTKFGRFSIEWTDRRANVERFGH